MQRLCIKESAWDGGPVCFPLLFIFLPFIFLPPSRRSTGASRPTAGQLWPPAAARPRPPAVRGSAPHARGSRLPPRRHSVVGPHNSSCVAPTLSASATSVASAGDAPAAPVPRASGISLAADRPKSGHSSCAVTSRPEKSVTTPARSSILREAGCPHVPPYNVGVQKILLSPR